MSETSLQPPRWQKEREEVLRALEQKFPCSPWRGPWWRRLSACSLWCAMSDHISRLQLEEVDVP